MVNNQNEADRQRPFWLALNQIKGLGPKRFNQLIACFGSAEKAWLAKEKDWDLINASSLKEEWLRLKKTITPNQLLDKLLSYRPLIWPLIKIDSYYPANLKTTDDCPPVLYSRGQIVERLAEGNQQSWQEFWSTPAISLVGTRQVTGYGRQVANRFSEGLAKNDLVIVSGMARGVDTLVHQATLAVGGKTVAVLGCGADVIYPSSNHNLYQNILDQGLIFSELFPGTTPLPGYFPARNRIIAGLSLAVVVLEGGIKSGSLITASLAANQGREVFAIPGNITSQLSSGTNYLIKNGATPITCVDDVLENLNIVPQNQEKSAVNLSEAERKLVALLSKNNLTTDKIAKQSGMSINIVNAILTKLEISGLIVNLGWGQWGIK